MSHTLGFSDLMGGITDVGANGHMHACPGWVGGD